MKKIIGLILAICMMCSGVCASTSVGSEEEVLTESGYKISFRKYFEDGAETGVIFCTNDGQKIWEFRTKPSVAAMVDAVSDCYINDDMVYIVDNDGLKAIDINNGQLKWTASGVGTTDIEFDKYGNIYNTAFDGLSLTVISKDGDVLYVEKDNSKYIRPFDLEIDGDTLYIYSEEGSNYNYEKNCAVNTMDISVFASVEISGYNDVLSELSQSEKDKLFRYLLPSFAGKDFDYRNTDSYVLLEEILPTAVLESYDNLGLKVEYGEPYRLILNLDEVTESIFGRVFDKDEFGEEILSENAEGFFFAKDGQWYQEGFGDMGVGGKDLYPKCLYDIGNNYFYTVAKANVINSGGDSIDEFICAYIIKKNDDDSYRIIRSYPAGYVLTKAELDAFVNPSDWAKTELAKAEQAGLIPELDGKPFMTENATRLQFAQLAVNLAEKVTGKKLTEASDTTFTDCKDTAVLKAYKAGIINGVSEDKFAPYDRLTREQLATMIWRTVEYIQNTTGKEKLTEGGTLSGYTDAADVSDYATEAVAALSENEIMKGTSETELSPKSNCTVEQSVILIYRTFGKMK